MPQQPSTPSTLAQLFAEFSDTAPPESIPPRAMRDFIASVSLVLPTIAALRANTSIAQSVVLLGYWAAGDPAGPRLYTSVLTDTTSPDNGGTRIVDAIGQVWYLATNGGAVSVALFGATGNQTDESAYIQAAHDWSEAQLSGAVTFLPGAIHNCLHGLIWDNRLVGLNGLGATLNYAGATPSNVGTQLVTGNNSTFATGTGSWTFTGCSTTLVSGGVKLTNTSSAQGYGVLTLTTVAGTWYAVNYTMSTGGSDLCQINVYANTANNTAGALGYCAAITNTGFVFQAKSSVTYLTARLSTAVSGDYATFGAITVAVTVPPLFLVRDRSNAFVYPINPGLGYVVNDILYVTGGSYATQASIRVTDVDGSGRVLSAQIENPGVTYTAYPPNPVATTGGTGTGFTACIGISTPLWGHEAHSVDGFNIIGPGRESGYTVDAVTPWSVYGAAGASLGFMLDSPEVAGNRNSTSSRGVFGGIVITNCTTGVLFRDQAFLAALNSFGIANCNFGVATLNGINGGENNVMRGGWITGCDLNVTLDGYSLTLEDVSNDFPKQALLRISAPSAALIKLGGHWEMSPPGDSTQTVPPVSLTGTSASFVQVGGDFIVTGSYVNGFNEMILTNNAAQSLIFDNVYINNLLTKYLFSGPGRATEITPFRLAQYPTVPTMLNDQVATVTGPAGPALDAFGFGGFEKPLVAASTKPRGLIALGSNLDDISFSQTYTAAFTSNLMTAVLTAANSHSGNQCLRLAKLNNSPTAGIIYLLAPCRPGFQYWWQFFYDAPIASGAAVNANVTVTQDFCQLLGVETFALSTSGVSSAAAGYNFRLAGPSQNSGQIFSGNSAGGLTITPSAGSNGWQEFSADVFNHGAVKAPAWATHCYLTLDFSNFDGALWGSFSMDIDDVACWPV